MSVAQVVHAAPPAPPGPMKFDYGRFGPNVATVMVDTQKLAINANVASVSRLKAFGDPSTPAVPGVTTAALGTQMLCAPSVDASNNAQYTPTVLLGNACTYVTTNVFVQGSMTVGTPFAWTPPAFSVISKPTIRLHGNTFTNLYPLNGGQLRGYFPLYVPQPPFASQGQIFDLNGGIVGGTATLYH